jgi:hypothetical protein
MKSSLVGLGSHLFGTGGNAYHIGAKLLAVGDLARRGGEQDDVGSHRVRDLDPHVAKSSETDDADLLARSGAPMAQRRVGRDAGAEEGRDTRQILFVVPDMQNKRLLDDDGLRITPVGILTPKHRTVVSSRESTLAVLLFAGMARTAMPATVDHAAHASQISCLEIVHLVAHGDHSANDFVSGD